MRENRLRPSPEVLIAAVAYGYMSTPLSRLVGWDITISSGVVLLMLFTVIWRTRGGT